MASLLSLFYIPIEAEFYPEGRDASTHSTDYTDRATQFCLAPTGNRTRDPSLVRRELYHRASRDSHTEKNVTATA